MEENEILGLREETREREINFVQILNQDRGKDRVGSCDIDRLNAAVGGCIYTNKPASLDFPLTSLKLTREEKLRFRRKLGGDFWPGSWASFLKRFTR